MGARCRGFIHDDTLSRGCAIADTLGWAATHGIPFSDAMSSLHVFGRPKAGILRPILWQFLMILPFSALLFYPDEEVAVIVLVILWWILVLLIRLPFRGNAKWVARIARVVKDLGEGRSLGSSLDRSLRRQLPGSYLAAVLHAETEGTLDSILPVLAEQFRYPYEIRRRRWSETVPIIVYGLIFALITSYLIQFYTPQIEYIFHDLSLTPVLTTHPPFWALFLVFGFVVVLPVVFILLPVVLPPVRNILIAIPWIGREYRDAFLIDLSRLICVYTRLGKDIRDAAVLYRDLTRSRWIRKRVNRFVSAMEAGKSWTDAWDTMGVGTPFEAWVLRNAESREDPASGFNLLMQWGQLRTVARTRALQLWFIPLAVLALGYVVGRFGVGFFTNMSSIVSHMIQP